MFESNSLFYWIYRLVSALQLPSSKVVVHITVTAAGSPPAGEDDGLGGFLSFAAWMAAWMAVWMMEWEVFVRMMNKRTAKTHNVILAAPVSSFPP